ncbi:MAG: hypothetical protein HQL99_03240 [Magnetococcales bacterium]|nr:hypothetical protein [Magnetococcales bacterium]
MAKTTPWTHVREQYPAFYANPEGMLVDFSRDNEIFGFSHPFGILELGSAYSQDPIMACGWSVGSPYDQAAFLIRKIASTVSGAF